MLFKKLFLQAETLISTQQKHFEMYKLSLIQKVTNDLSDQSLTHS